MEKVRPRCGQPSDQCLTDSELGHLGQLSRPGHRVIILTRCDPSFSGV